MADDWDLVEDEDNDQKQEQDEGLDLEATQKLARTYHAAKVGTQREALWSSYSEEQREALNSLGIRGPLRATDGNFEPVTLDEDELRHMDPSARKEARDEFDKVTKKAEGTFEAGLNSLMRKEIDASQETLDMLAGIRDRADRAADPMERSLLLQRGAEVIEVLRGPKRPGFDTSQRPQKSRQYFDGLTNRMMLTEIDQHGNERTSVLNEENHRDQFMKPPLDLTFPEVVSIAEFRSWPYEKQRAFITKHPDSYDALLHASEDRTDQEANRRVNVRLGG